MGTVVPGPKLKELVWPISVYLADLRLADFVSNICLYRACSGPINIICTGLHNFYALSISVGLP